MMRKGLGVGGVSSASGAKPGRRFAPGLVKLSRILGCVAVLLLMRPVCAVAQSGADAGVETSPDDTTRFALSQECAMCHAFSPRAAAMRDAADRNVAPYDLWSGSMMANSAVDPYWKAVVSAEVAATPAQKAHIEEICSRCHAPMAAPVPASPDGEVLAFLRHPHPRATLGEDGVSCTVCHLMSEDRLGTPESYTGGFAFNKEHAIYGPHANPVSMPMQRHVGYTPAKGDHLLRSALCATCHTVITGSFDAKGKETHSYLHEQVPYLEWRNSIFSDEGDAGRATGRSCQNCHVPQTDVDGVPIEARLAHNPGGRDFPFLRSRQPYGRHTFAGGNAFMIQLIRDNRERLNLATPPEAFDRVLAETRKMLQSSTATVELGDLEIGEKETVIPVRVGNLAGHKFPTAYPSRRAWLEVTIRDRENRIAFSSGRVNANGEIVDADDRVLASERAGGPMQPHRQTISSPAEVQVYETIMKDAEGRPTFALLRGSEFQKDNRLLPRGWSKDHQDAEATRPIGVAGDEDFEAGHDTTRFFVPLSSGRYSVEVRLLFQSLSSRYVAELFTHTTPEVRAFQAMYSSADLAPETIASVRAEFTVP